jgi:hypothetical protein
MSTNNSDNKPNTTPPVPTHSMPDDTNPELTHNPFKTIYARDLDKPAAL